MAGEEHPIEAFRRVTAATMRAISERDGRSRVSFGARGAAGRERRRGCPCRRANSAPAEVRRLRGEADAMALQLRYHDDALHDRASPRTEAAQAVFDALEQVRVETLGARRMQGVAANLAAALEERCRAQGLAHAESQDDVPMAEARALSRARAAVGRARRRNRPARRSTLWR